MANIDREGYSVLRYGGASQAQACAELGVNSGRAFLLEAAFHRSARRQRGPETMLPAYARHEAHVRAVAAAGGYPALKR